MEPGELRMAEVELRECRASDIEAVLTVWRLADAVPRPTDNAESLAKRLERDDGLFLVAEVGGQIVGTNMGGWDGWRGSHYRLAVDPPFRRRGIASALVRETESRLRTMGAERISIRVFRCNSKRAVLVVDDDSVLAECVANALRQVGWQARAAHGGKPALHELARHGFEVVLLDVDMPDVDGREVLRGLRARGDHVPVLMMSGLASAAEARAGGASDLLPKPFSLSELIEALSRVATEATQPLAEA